MGPFPLKWSPISYNKMDRISTSGIIVNTVAVSVKIRVALLVWHQISPRVTSFAIDISIVTRDSIAASGLEEFWSSSLSSLSLSCARCLLPSPAMTEANGEKATVNGAAVTEPKEMVITGTEYSGFKTTVALAIWLGGIHINVVLVLLALFVLPSRIALMLVFPFFFLLLFPISYWPGFWLLIAFGAPGLDRLCRVIAVQLFFMVIPIDDKSKFGRKLSRWGENKSLSDNSRDFHLVMFWLVICCLCFYRFICKYACGYFPITLHLEDYNAFDPKQTYGEILT